MQSIRPIRALHLRPSPIASSSRQILSAPRIPSRYLIIRDFFTRHGEALAHPVTPPSHLRVPRWRCNHTSAPPPYDPSSKAPDPQRPGDCPHCHAPPSARRDHAQNYTPFIQRLIRQSSLAVKPNYRPSKEELLGAASSWWERLRIRIKWFTIRGWRRFNTDDLSAFASWFVLGNTLWILIGTTTFVSAVFATLNSLSLQEYVARWISDYMTSETGVTVIFESAIVPRWGANTITFRNVYISRRPAESAADPAASSVHPPAPRKAITTTPPTPIPFLSNALSPNTYYAPPADESDNYTMYDVNLDEVEVTLSFTRWLDGKGLVKDARIKGVRGVIDRRSVWWDMSKPLEPADFRHEVRAGDFEFESLSVEDALLTIYQPGGQRPYNVSVFNASIGPFRKRYLFYDMMAAEAITGQFDNCLFSLHMPQKLGRVISEEDGVVKRMARFRVDGMPIEHIQYATGHTGPTSWITSGKLDAVLDIKFPFHPDEQVDLRNIIDQIGRNVGRISQGDHPDSAPSQPASQVPVEADATASVRREAVLPERAHLAQAPQTEGSRARDQAAVAAEAAATTSSTFTPGLNPGAHRLQRPPLRAPSHEAGMSSAKAAAAAAADASSVQGGSSGNGQAEPLRQVTIDIDLRFRDLKAAMPLYTTDLSVTNNALVRPIVAFINANRTLVPIHCRVAADLSDFEGSWTLFETGLMTSISDQIYDALAHHVSSEAANTKRLRQVSMWGIQRGAEALLDTLRHVVDPVHGQLVGGAGAGQ